MGAALRKKKYAPHHVKKGRRHRRKDDRPSDDVTGAGQANSNEIQQQNVLLESRTSINRNPPSRINIAVTQEPTQSRSEQDGKHSVVTPGVLMRNTRVHLENDYMLETSVMDSPEYAGMDGSPEMTSEEIEEKRNSGVNSEYVLDISELSGPGQAYTGRTGESESMNEYYLETSVPEPSVLDAERQGGANRIDEKAWDPIKNRQNNEEDTEYLLEENESESTVSDGQVTSLRRDVVSKEVCPQAEVTGIAKQLTWADINDDDDGVYIGLIGDTTESPNNTDTMDSPTRDPHHPSDSNNKDDLSADNSSNNMAEDQAIGGTSSLRHISEADHERDSNTTSSSDSENEDPFEMITPEILPPMERRFSQKAVESRVKREHNKVRRNSVQMRYKARSCIVESTVPPLPPRHDLRKNETDNAPGVNRRHNENSLSMVLPLGPSKRLSRRKSGGFVSPPNPESPDANRSVMRTPPVSDECVPSEGCNILPLPPKPKSMTLQPHTQASSMKKYARNPTPRSHLGHRRSGSLNCHKDSINSHLPRRAQTLHRDQFKDEDAQFMCLLDLPLKEKGSVVSPEKLTEKNVHDLLTSAKKGETDHVRTLLNKVSIDINVSDEDAMTALHYACRSGNPQTVSLLIDRGASINAKTVYGSEPLMIALREKPEIETARKWHQRDVAQVVHYLICAGASVHSSDVNGLSTLLVAISVENNYTVDYLLDNGADPNFPLQFRSVLHVISIQVSRGIAWIEIERKMLENGANPNRVDCCGHTPASLLFYSEFTPFTESDIKEYSMQYSTDHLDYERYMELPAVLRLGRPNKNTFGYTRKRLNRLLRHLQAGLDLNKLPMDMMLQLDKFLLREQNEDVLRLFHACGHYPSVATLQAFIPNQVDTFEDLWELLESPATLMLTAASVVRVNTRTSAHLNAKQLPLPKSIIEYITLGAFEEVFKSFQQY